MTPTPRQPASAPELDFGDPFDQQTSDDTDEGWGDARSSSSDDDLTRFLSEKPPHHL